MTDTKMPTNRATRLTLCGSLSLHPVSTGAAMHLAGYRALDLPFTYVPFRVTDLAGVVYEIALKDRSLFGEIVRDVQRMAEPARLPAPRQFTAQTLSLGESANSNEFKKAA